MMFAVKCMMFEYTLTQRQIETLNEEEYSLFLAYGDTFRDTETDQPGAGSSELWETEVTRVSETAAREKLLISQCVWNSKYLSRSTSGN